MPITESQFEAKGLTPVAVAHKPGSKQVGLPLYVVGGKGLGELATV